MISTSNLKKLVEQQKKLDEAIANSKKITANTEIITKKIIALLVELGEFINEERSFKYWSNKPSSEKSILLEEYVDGIHFTISLGININFNFEIYEFNFINNDIISAYILCFENILQFNSRKDENNYKIMLDSFFSIGKVLNFSEEEIIEAYSLKNKINFIRQENNY